MILLNSPQKKPNRFFLKGGPAISLETRGFPSPPRDGFGSINNHLNCYKDANTMWHNIAITLYFSVKKITSVMLFVREVIILCGLEPCQVTNSTHIS